ncbi:hypothetical protein AB0F15_33200 [Amycolatopsis sp. NPDC026612]|uniref:hypothetical protein n=1 Tax=Amycolatopsis sp. NPDC026612 TaxID=3155466 RepID=UPI0033ED770F
MAVSDRSSSSDTSTIVRAVSAIMGTVVGLTFLFGFGSVLGLALRLGVPIWVAPLVAPAVDLSILGLLLGTRHLALTGASQAVLRPARRLLIFASVVTLALNVAEPLVAGEYGKAAFDAVGPLLLIGWAEVGAGLLQAIGEAGRTPVVLDFAEVENAEERVQEKSNGRSACGQTPAWPAWSIGRFRWISRSPGRISTPSTSPAPQVGWFELHGSAASERSVAGAELVRAGAEDRRPDRVLLR